MTRQRCGRYGDRLASSAGFGLLVPLVVLLTGLVAIVFVVGGQLLLGVTVSKEEETRQQLVRLVRTIVGAPGDPDGFVSDVGRLPKSLEELNNTAGTHTLCDAAFNPSVVSIHQFDGATEHRGHVPMGWEGPYVRDMFAAGDYLVDAWGQNLRYTCSQSTKPASDPTTSGLDLTLRSGQITSAGADGAFGTQDDIASDVFQDNGHIFMTVTVGASTATPTSIRVTLYYPVNGEQMNVSSAPTTLATAEGSQKLLVFQSVPAGIRFVEIEMQPKSESIHVKYDANVANAMSYVLPIR